MLLITIIIISLWVYIDVLVDFLNLLRRARAADTPEQREVWGPTQATPSVVRRQDR